MLITSCASSTSSTDSASPSAPVQTAAAACTPARPATPGSTKLTVDGTSRDYTINIPPGYDEPKRCRWSWHFMAEEANASQQLLLTSFDTSSDKNNFILVLPNAIKGAMGPADHSGACHD